MYKNTLIPYNTSHYKNNNNENMPTLHRYLIASLFGLFTTSLFAYPLPNENVSGAPFQSTNDKRWGILVYHSWMTSNNIGAVLTWQDVHLKYGTK